MSTRCGCASRGSSSSQLTGRDLSRMEDRVDFYLALSAAGELPADPGSIALPPAASGP